MKWGCCLAAAVAAFCMGAGVCHASGPIGVYALVDKVTFEPSADHPERIRMSGVFVISSVPDGCGSPSNPCSTSYSSPQKGYLYFSLPKQNADQALREWQDVKSLAGKGDVFGFGSGWFRNDAKVRKEGDPQEPPQVWPINNTGVVVVPATQTQAKVLLQFKGE